MRIILVSALLIATIASSSGEDYLDIGDVTMELKNGSAIFEVKYELDPIARFYVLTLGCKYIEPDLISLLGGFEGVKVVRAGPTFAVLAASGAGEYCSGYYLFDSRPLATQLTSLKVVFPDGPPRTFYNVNATPNVFCKA
jgi:hypothetical protein